MQQYNLGIEYDDTGILIDLGNSPGWVEEHKDKLSRATRITLVPKSEGSHLRAVVVNLDGNKRWVYFSRVFGQVASPVKMRIQCIGWQMNIGNQSVKSLTWVYPNGIIENGDEPTLAPKLLQNMIINKEETNG